MDPNDASNFNNQKPADGPFWVYGIEQWCNLEGQHVHILSDLSNLSGQAYEMSICNLGIMGTEYIFETAAPPS